MAEHETIDQSAGTSTKPSGRAADAARRARERAARTASTVTDTLESRPLAAIGGALAVGAIAAALIPTTDKEVELLGPVAERMREKFDDAVVAAREAGVGELSAAGLTLAAASNGLGGVVGSLAKAALAAGGAAATTVKQKRPAAPAVEEAMNDAKDGARLPPVATS